MTVETATFISDLNPANPAPNDPKSEGDDHFRLLKQTLLNSFPGFAGAVAATGTDGGAVNAYTLTPSNALPSYSARMNVVFSPAVTNTGAATLNVSGLGVKPVVSVAGTPLVAGDLVAGSIYKAAYDGASFRLLAVTKNYVDQLAFSGTLPAQTGNAGKFITTDGTNATWGNLLKASVVRFVDGTDATKLAVLDLSGLSSGTSRTYALPDASGTLALRTDTAMQLIGQATVGTAVANIDFLNIFSAAYDTYVIDVLGLAPSAAFGLQFQAAVGGSVVSTANYGSGSGDQTTLTLATSFQLISTNVGANQDATLSIEISNANSTTKAKKIVADGYCVSNTSAYVTVSKRGTFASTSAMTGFRLLWGGAANFVSGTVRVYGIKNS